MANEQEMYNQGYTSTATCGNNICEKMYFEINPDATETHKINGQNIVVKTETSNEERPRTAFSFNEIKDRFGGAAQEINSQLKSKYGFSVSSISGEYGPNFPEVQIPKYYRVEILEENYCPNDCMQGLGKVDIKQGWNILSQEILTDLRINNINEGFNYEPDIFAVYQYVPILNKFILMKPRDDVKETKIANELVSKVGESKAEEVFEQRNKAVWAYSTKTTTLYYKKDSIKLGSNGLNSIHLFSGWNFITLSPEMSGKTLNQIKGNCNIERFYFYMKEGDSGGWTENLADFLSTRQIDDDWEGIGFVLKVSDECSFKTPAERDETITPPPTIPN